MTPLEKTEALYRELVAWYGDGEQRETRAAAKLLMVALAQLKAHGGPGWDGLVQDYLTLLKQDPERFQRMLDANRGQDKRQISHPDGTDSFVA